MGYAALSASSASASTANNTMIGSSSGASLSGQDNVAVGYNTAYSNKTGNGNTTIGTNSDVADTLSNATAIGQNSRVEASNSLVLGSINGINNATASAKIGIGTTTPNSSLQVAGSVSMSIKTISSDYTITDSDYTIIKNSDGIINVKLPDPANTNIGRIIYVVNRKSGSIKVYTDSPLKIAKYTSILDSVSFSQNAMLQSDGTYWYQISGS